VTVGGAVAARSRFVVLLSLSMALARALLRLLIHSLLQTRIVPAYLFAK